MSDATMTTAGAPKDKLWTRSYVFICLANFLMCFAFYILVPTLPFYLADTFNAGETMIGIILSCYTVAVLLVRPFSGWMADSLPRKPLYLLLYFLFTAFFGVYLIVGGIAELLVVSALLMFGVVRVLHGFIFGTITTTGNTLVIDIMPSSRRGEGLGYYGVMNNLAMSIGPMSGLFISSTGNYDLIFYASLISGAIGMVFAILIKVERKVPKTRNKGISLDRFFLKAGLPACISLLCLAIPWGMTMTFIAMYAKELGMVHNTGFFFTVMAVGLIISRIGSGKRVDRGQITQVKLQGMIVLTVGILCEAFLGRLVGWNVTAGYIAYFTAAFFIGFGYGTLFPAYNTMIINLAPNDRRATANATYLTGWDVGMGLGMLFGGRIADHFGFEMLYFVDVVLALLSIAWYVSYVVPHFNRHKLR